MNYISILLYRWYDKIYKYFYKNDNLEYYNPIFEILERKDETINIQLEEFRGNDDKFTQVMFLLNNTPEIVHKCFFSDNKKVCSKFFQIYLKKINGNYQSVYNNLKTLNNYIDDSNIRYIFIRVNLINDDKKMNHVNGIIINKLKKDIIIFEPTVVLKYSTNLIKNILDEFNLENYDYLIPNDLGYNRFNSLQRFDYFCQTYILLVFMILIESENKNEIENYSDMNKLLNKIITFESMELLWFVIYKILILEKDMEMYEPNIIWKYPNNSLGYILYPFKLKDQTNNFSNDHHQIEISEKDIGDLVIIEKNI